jgi:hypothetical protein
MIKRWEIYLEKLLFSIFDQIIQNNIKRKASQHIIYFFLYLPV